MGLRRGAGFLLTAVGWAWVIAASPTALAQLPNLVELGLQYMPPVDLAGPGPTSVQGSSYDAAINVPIVLGERTFLVPGVAYHVDSVAYGDAPQLASLRAFHSVELTVLFVQLLPKDWALSVRLAPGLAGDLQRVDAGVWRLSSVVLATHAFSDRFTLGGGGLTTFSFGSFLVLPAVYLEYKPTPRWTIEAFIPAFLEVHYRFGDRVQVGVAVSVSGNEYAVDGLRSAWPCVAQAHDDPTTEGDERQAQPADCVDHLAYSVATAGVKAGVRLFETVWLTAFAGYSFFRRSEMMNADNELVSGGGQDIPNTLAIRAALEWRIPTE